MNFVRHPLSACFGDMDAEEFQSLKGDIEAHGQHEPVMIFEGMVLDGWHRYQAVEQLGLRLQKFNFEGTFEDAQERVVSANAKRRHQTVAQRAQAIVAVAACLPKGRPQKNNSAPGAELPAAKTAQQLAQKHGVGTRSIERARTVHQAGLSAAVIDGSLSAKEAEALARGPAAKPPQKAKRELPAPPAAPDSSDELHEAQHTITDLAQENEQLRDKLAVESMDASEEEKTQAAETIRELRALVKTQEAEIAALKVSRDTYMRESSEAKKDAIYWRKKAKAAGAEA